MNLGLLASVPVALILSPSALNFPLDIALGVAFPVHIHIGFNYIITDYCPKQFKAPAQWGMVALTAIMIIGLLKINLTGPGLTELVKSVWREPKKIEKQE